MDTIEAALNEDLTLISSGGKIAAQLCVAGIDLDVDVNPESDIITSLQDLARESGLLPPGSKPEIFFAGDRVDKDCAFTDYQIDEGAKFSIVTSKFEMDIKRGLLLWLTGKRGVRFFPTDRGPKKGFAWSNPDFPEGFTLLGAPGEPPSFCPVSRKVGFSYDNWGTLSCAERPFEVRPNGLPDGVRTIISVHSMVVPTRGAQFYIIAGEHQGPLHSAGGNTKGCSPPCMVI